MMELMKPKPEIKLEDWGTIGQWLGDSQVWMDTAVNLDRESGRGASNVEANYHKLNVAHVATGLAFELALKALAKSECRQPTRKHEALKNYRALSKKSQSRIENKVKTGSLGNVDVFLNYLDERMCHPDRKYWMEGKKGQRRGTGFANVSGLVIPDLHEIHQFVVDLAGENTWSNWTKGMRLTVGKIGHLGPYATISFDANGGIETSVTEEGRRAGFSIGVIDPEGS